MESARRIEEKSAVFAKELRLGDLVFSQITMVVGATWIGTAGKLGSLHVVYWLVAAVFFFLPSAAVVVFLSRRLPLEGGLYQWAKYGLGERAGFMVAFNLWVYAIVIISSEGLELSTCLSYTFGAKTAWMATSRPFIAVVSVVLVGSLALLAALGLRVGRWLHNMGGLSRLFAYVVLVALAGGAFLSGHAPARAEPTVPVPVLSVFALNLLGKMGFGAFSGFEYMAIFAGEAKNAQRALGRSVVLAAPLIVAMFVLGTASLLVFVPPDEIDLISPLPQAVSRAASATASARYLSPIIGLTLAMELVGYGSASFSGVTRLPLVAGWDGLLPRWFTKLHPTRKTPVNSIVLVAAFVLATGLGGMTGVGEQEAYQLLGSVALVLYALTYVALFAIPIVGKIGGASPLVRAAAASGMAMTLLFIGLSIFPIVKTRSDALFTAKIVGGALLANCAGLALYHARKRRAPAAPSRAE